MDNRRFVIIILFAVFAAASCKDLIITGGNSEAEHKIYDQTFEASPAVWRQIQNVTVNTTENEVISRIEVTDLRDDKNGEADIVEGGEGNKSVTIELKSPTVLRGYNFHVAIYATPEDSTGPVPFDPTIEKKLPNKPNEDGLQFNTGEDITAPKHVGAEASTTQPILLSTEINEGKRPARETKTKNIPENLNKNTNYSENPVELKGNQKPFFNDKTDSKSVENSSSEDKAIGLEPKEFDDGSKIIPGFINKSPENSTHLPTFAKNLKTNEGLKRHARDVSTQDKLISTSKPDLLLPKSGEKSDSKQVDPLLPKWFADNNTESTEKIAGFGAKKDEEFHQAKTVKNGQSKTTLPDKDQKLNEDHKIHAREVTKQDKTTTSVPPKISDQPDVKHIDEPVVPNWSVDDPKPPSTATKQYGFQEKSEKDEQGLTTTYNKGVSTTTTDKPRAVRDTENYKPDQEHVQKIPSDGRVHTDLKTQQGLDAFSSTKPDKKDQNEKTVTTPKNFAQTRTSYVPNAPIAITLQPKGDFTTQKIDLKNGGGPSSSSTTPKVDSQSDESKEDDVASARAVPFPAL